MEPLRLCPGKWATGKKIASRLLLSLIAPGVPREDAGGAGIAEKYSGINPSKAGGCNLTLLKSGAAVQAR